MSFEDELKRLRKGQETMNLRLSRIEGFLVGTQGYQAPSVPRPMTKAECEKLKGTWDPDTGKCTLEESVVIASPMTKEACEKAGGTWDDEKKTCKLPEGTQSFRGILPTVGVLPTSTPTLTSDEAKANAIIEKIVGKKKE